MKIVSEGLRVHELRLLIDDVLYNGKPKRFTFVWDLQTQSLTRAFSGEILEETCGFQYVDRVSFHLRFGEEQILRIKEVCRAIAHQMVKKANKIGLHLFWGNPKW